MIFYNDNTGKIEWKESADENFTWTVRDTDMTERTEYVTIDTDNSDPIEYYVNFSSRKNQFWEATIGDKATNGRVLILNLWRK